MAGNIYFTGVVSLQDSLYSDSAQPILANQLGKRRRWLAQEAIRSSLASADLDERYPAAPADAAARPQLTEDAALSRQVEPRSVTIYGSNGNGSAEPLLAEKICKVGSVVRIAGVV